MVSEKGIALRLMECLIRGIQLSCSAVILGINAYFLHILHSHDLRTPRWIRAVVGISAASIIYTSLITLLFCFLAGHPIFTAVSAIFDLIFFGAFIYVAYADRSGARSCHRYGYTPIGAGYPHDRPTGFGGHFRLPTYRFACRLEKVTLALSIITLIFFLLSIIVAWVAIRRRRREKQVAATGNGHDAHEGHNGHHGHLKRWF
ncbi:hypothetical protein F4779DRAFT_616559 [Xylariaceae sp. FL0662B]|nr:hypothetical protein F4779DRAFT_616559 [Xylariaceae sp. FL0662B]